MYCSDSSPATVALSPPELLAGSFVSEFLIPLTNDFIENDGALGEGAGLVPAVLSAPPPTLLVTEYIEGGFILRPPGPFAKLVERGTGLRRVVEDEVEGVGGIEVAGRGDAGLSVE